MARAPATRTGRAGCPLATRVPSAWRGSTAASRAVGRIKSSRFHPSGPPANLIRGRSMRTFLTWSSPLRSGSSLSARSSRSASRNGPDHGARSVISRSRMVTPGDGRRWTRRLLAVTLRFSSWLARLVRIPRYRSWSRRSGPARSTMTSPPKTRSNPRSQRRPRLVTLPAPSRLLSLESREKQLAHHLWIGLAATGLHHHADQKGEALYLPFPVVGDRPGMFGKHLLNNLEQRVLVGDLGQPLLLHDQLGRFPGLIHLPFSSLSSAANSAGGIGLSAISRPSLFKWPKSSTITQLLASFGSWQLFATRSEEHTSELQSPLNLVCRL